MLCFFLLTFPEGVILDNCALSGEMHELQKKCVPLADKKEACKKDLCGVAVHWEIAEKCGGQKIKSSEDEDTDKLHDGM